MADKLIVYERRNVYRIGWYLSEDGSLGSALGETPGDYASDVAPLDRGEWESWIAERTAASSKPGRDTFGYYWTSRQEALRVLTAIKAGLKQVRPLPEWAKTAIEAGWKPPNGWKA